MHIDQTLTFPHVSLPQKQLNGAIKRIDMLQDEKNAAAEAKSEATARADTLQVRWQQSNNDSDTTHVRSLSWPLCLQASALHTYMGV